MSLYNILLILVWLIRRSRCHCAIYFAVRIGLGFRGTIMLHYVLKWEVHSVMNYLPKYTVMSNLIQSGTHSYACWTAGCHSVLLSAALSMGGCEQREAVCRPKTCGGLQLDASLSHYWDCKMERGLIDKLMRHKALRPHGPPNTLHKPTAIQMTFFSFFSESFFAPLKMNRLHHAMQSHFCFFFSPKCFALFRWENKCNMLYI